MPKETYVQTYVLQKITTGKEKQKLAVFFFTFHRRLDFSVWKEAVDRLRIRLHTAHMGHPTVCDAKYCSATTFKEREGRAMEIRRVTRSN